MAGSHKTQDAIRKAMVNYRAQVLHERYYDIETGIYKYPFPITEKEILSSAGIKSRSTLKARYHDRIKTELREFVLELKIKTGRKVTTDEVGSSPSGKRASSKSANKTRVEQMADTIGALGYKIIALQNQLKGAGIDPILPSTIEGLPKGPNKQGGDGRGRR